MVGFSFVNITKYRKVAKGILVGNTQRGFLFEHQTVQSAHKNKYLFGYFVILNRFRK